MAEIKDKPKTSRYSDRERDIIKNTLSDDLTLDAIRKCFFDVKLSPSEKSLLKKLTPEAVSIVKKTFNPELSIDIPAGQNIDLMMTVEIKDKSLEESLKVIEARIMLIDLLNKGMARVEENETDISSKIGIMKFETQRVVDRKFLIELIARNTLITHVESMIVQLKVLSRNPSEEESEKARKKNSVE